MLNKDRRRVVLFFGFTHIIHKIKNIFDLLNTIRKI